MTDQDIRSITEGASCAMMMAIMPIDDTALTPRLSGLAIGFAVMRCKTVPAIASIVPAAIAPKMRGPRHGQTVCRSFVH